MKNGRRRPSCDGTSRMTRECQVRICERLGVKYPGPTRHSRPRHSAPQSTVVRCYSNSDRILRRSEMTLCAISVRELERIEVVGAETTYSLARQP